MRKLARGLDEIGPQARGLLVDPINVIAQKRRVKHEILCSADDSSAGGYSGIIV